MTLLHAGGKFGAGGYKVSGGLHGVGLSVVNALSVWLKVTIYRNGHIYTQDYSRGQVMNELRIVGDTEQIGTVIVSQKPASVSSILLSTISYTR